MSATLATAFIPIVLITMTDGTEVQAVGDTYPTYESCRNQGDHDAKLMGHEADKLDPQERVIKTIQVWCEPMPDGYEPHHGYIPVYRGGSHD